MESVLNVIVVFKDKPVGTRLENFLDVVSAKVREGGYYQIIMKDGEKIKLPLTSIERIVENTVEKGSE